MYYTMCNTTYMYSVLHDVLIEKVKKLGLVDFEYVLYLVYWSNSVLRLGHLLVIIQSSGFYLFGCLVLVKWTHLNFFWQWNKTDIIESFYIYNFKQIQMWVFVYTWLTWKNINVLCKSFHNETLWLLFTTYIFTKVKT